MGGLTVEGLDEREIGSRKGRTLLKVLATARGAPLTADRIADVLWGEALPARPADQVGVLVSRLRAVLGADRFTRTDAGYALRVDWLDLDELETRVDEAERRRAAGQTAAARAAAEAALALVRGPLLPDENGEWIDAARAVAETTARRAQVVLVEAALDAGDHGAAVAAAEAMLAADPYDEVTLRALMRGHAGAGRPASALAAYVRVREKLAEDLGVSPTAPTEALHDAIVMGTVGPADAGIGARRSAALEAHLPGRDHELALLADVLSEVASGGNAFVLVTGEPGIGKTALVEAAAARTHAADVAVVRGDADVRGLDLPLQPLLDGLAAALRAIGSDEATVVLGPDHELLESLLGWRKGTASVPSATVLSDAEAGRALVFACVLASLERLASGRVLLLALDDLHGADVATLEWIDFAMRRGRRIAVFAAARPAATNGRVAPTHRIELGPLDITAAAAIVGEDRAAELRGRSGGNPLFLVELARSEEAVPATIREAVTTRVDTLGSDVSQTLRTAAVLGPELDLDLLATVVGRPVASLLDDADAAARAGLVREHGTTYVFAHELVREALAAELTAGRRAFVHREAARTLAGRVDADAKTVAWHAAEGGDVALAAGALVEAAAEAAARYDHDEADRLLADAIALADGPDIRLARARLRMAQWDVVGAREDADVARRLDPGAAAFEVAGWVSYYARDYEAAQRYADEGAERAADDAVRSSCLALGGRIRHARGQLHDAEPRLVEAAACRVTEVRSVAQVWLAVLRAHQGDSDQARDWAERALLQPDRFAHPFGSFHGQFSLALAVGMQGRAADLLSIATGLERHATEAGVQGRRFVPIAMNLRAWPLRAAGRTSEAVDVLEHALELCDPDAPSIAEPRRVAMLDLVDGLLDAGNIEYARIRLECVASELADWDGTMAWRARQRLGLARARLHLLTGDFAAAHDDAEAVAADAAASGNGRHRVIARCVAAEAASRMGQAVEVVAVEHDLVALDRTAGLEAWLVTARVAAACDVDRWWSLAERRAAALAASAGALADDLRRYVERSLEALRSPR